MQSLTEMLRSYKKHKLIKANHWFSVTKWYTNNKTETNKHMNVQQIRNQKGCILYSKELLQTYITTIIIQ